MTHLGELLSAYLDGELRSDEHNRVLSHLDICGSCRNDLGEIHSARSMVRSLPTLEAPVWILTDRDADDLDPRRRPVVRAAAAAAAVLVATIGVSTWLAPTPQLELTITEIATPYQVRSSFDGPPTGARLLQIVPFSPGGAE